MCCVQPEDVRREMFHHLHRMFWERNCLRKPISFNFTFFNCKYSYASELCQTSSWDI